MKKTISIFALVGAMFFWANTASAQAQKYVNFGGAGTGLYASIEFPISSLISLAPQFSTDYNFNAIVLAAKGNFYFDEVFEITDPWDVYAGANFGWRIDNGNDGVSWGFQVGARWFWSDKWGVNAEFGGGSGVLGGIGLTMKL